jgi:hypothetical protein
VARASRSSATACQSRPGSCTSSEVVTYSTQRHTQSRMRMGRVG